MFIRQVNAYKTRHCYLLPLFLLMLRIFANNANNTVTLNNLAFVANRFHAGPDFHFKISLNYSSLQVTATQPSLPGQAFVVVHLQKPLDLAHGVQVNAYHD